MKFRRGFVSNSSSSSFVLALGRKPESVDDLHRMMFPEGPTSIYAYDHNGISSEDAAKTVFKDIQEQEPLTRDALVEEFDSGTVITLDGNGYHSAFPDYPTGLWDLPKEQQLAAYAEYGRKTREAAESVAAELQRAYPDSLFFCVSYSDNDGSYYTTMEHGNVFRNIPNIRISHH